MPAGGGSYSHRQAIAGARRAWAGARPTPLPRCLGLERELDCRQPSHSRKGSCLARRRSAPICPLFLIGGAVAGVGRGEEVYPLPRYSIAAPLRARSAGNWSFHPPGLPRLGQPASGIRVDRAPPPQLQSQKLSRLIAAAFGDPHSSGVFSEAVDARVDRAEDPLLALVRTGIENDFERVVFPQYPFLGEIKRILAAGSGTEDAAVYAGLSGSGSALFGLYHTLKGAQAAVSRLERHGVTSLITSTLPRSDYWRTMMMADAAPSWAID